MKVLVIGGGGREHALVWKLAQSRRVEKIWCAAGNGRIAAAAECYGGADGYGDVLGPRAGRRRAGPMQVCPGAARVHGSGQRLSLAGRRLVVPYVRAVG